MTSAALSYLSEHLVVPGCLAPRWLLAAEGARLGAAMHVTPQLNAYSSIAFTEDFHCYNPHGVVGIVEQAEPQIRSALATVIDTTVFE